VYIRRTADCEPITANDGCAVRELLHPKEAAVGLPYSLAEARVAPGARSYRHKLASAEVYYILEGCGVMHVDAEARPCMRGDVVHVPAEAVQWIENPGIHPLRFLCIVSPPWRAEDDTRLE